jgi:hypothetical protein
MEVAWLPPVDFLEMTIYFHVSTVTLITFLQSNAAIPG